MVAFNKKKKKKKKTDWIISLDLEE